MNCIYFQDNAVYCYWNINQSQRQPFINIYVFACWQCQHLFEGHVSVYSLLFHYYFCSRLSLISIIVYNCYKALLFQLFYLLSTSERNAWKWKHVEIDSHVSWRFWGFMLQKCQDWLVILVMLLLYPDLNMLLNRRASIE